MLERKQLLINDWLVEYINDISEEYDISFSEIVRLSLCLQFIDLIKKIFPSYKPKVANAQLVEFIQQRNKGKLDYELFHRFMSSVYFEARKAIEFRAKKEKEQ